MFKDIVRGLESIVDCFFFPEGTTFDPTESLRSGVLLLVFPGEETSVETE